GSVFVRIDTGVGVPGVTASWPLCNACICGVTTGAAAPTNSVMAPHKLVPGTAVGVSLDTHTFPDLSIASQDVVLVPLLVYSVNTASALLPTQMFPERSIATSSGSDSPLPVSFASETPCALSFSTASVPLLPLP